MNYRYAGDTPLRAHIMEQLAERNAGSRRYLSLLTDKGLLFFEPTNYPRGGVVDITVDGRDVSVTFDRPTDIIVS